MTQDKRNLLEKSFTISLLIVVIAVAIALATSSNMLLNTNIPVQAQQQQTQSSVQHNAKGHESHQVVNLQNATEGVMYKGTVTFNSSKPVDIIAYEDVTTGQTNTNATVKDWEVGEKKYTPQTLMKNATEGTVNFQGSGILTHSTSSEPYKVTFAINVNPIESQ